MVVLSPPAVRQCLALPFRTGVRLLICSHGYGATAVQRYDIVDAHAVLIE